MAEGKIPRRLRWFSDGAASAVAAMLDMREHGPDAGIIVHCDTGAEDEDNHRFRADCVRWLNAPVETIRSEKYTSTYDVWERRKYMAGINGAVCTDAIGDTFVASMTDSAETVCELGSLEDDESQSRLEADARLIAAAPELLAALIEAREALHFHYTEWDGEPEDAVPLQLARSKCDAAIAKTRGEP